MLAANKKFEKLGINPDYKGSVPHENSPSVGRRVYSFRPASRKPIKQRIYEVGFVSVYIVFVVAFVLSLINKLITTEGVYNSLDENISLAIKCGVYLLIFIVPSLIYCKTLGKGGFSSCGIRRFSLSYTGYIALSLILMILIIAAEKFAIAYYFTGASSDETANLFASTNKIGVIIAHALFPAICEEIMIRGVIQNEISKKAGGFSGIVISSLAFALIHLDARYFIIFLTSGLILSLVMHITSSVIPCIFMHAVNNIFSLCFSSQLTFIASERAGNLFVFVILMIFVFIVALVLLKTLEMVYTKKAVSVDLANSEDTESTEENTIEKSKTIRFYTQPTRLISDTGYTFHKFLRVLFSPAIIVSVIVFIFANI